MLLLRRPVARSTTSAVLASLDLDQRDHVADLVLGWIDALGPVIAARRPSPPVEPGTSQRSATRAWRSKTPWPRIPEPRRPTPDDGDHAGRGHPGPDRRRRLAAGLARQPPDDARRTRARCLGDAAPDPSHVDHRPHQPRARWISGGQRVPSGAIVLRQSPAPRPPARAGPGRSRRPARFDPRRWQSGTQRPGAWLPFGAGPHACPGRHLGMALLTAPCWVGAFADSSRLSERVTHRPESGHRPATVSFHDLRRKGAGQVIEHARSAGHRRSTDRRPPGRPRLAASIFTGDASLDEAVALMAEHFLSEPRVETS